MKNGINETEMLHDFNGFKMKKSEACVSEEPFEITEQVLILIKRIG